MVFCMINARKSKKLLNFNLLLVGLMVLGSKLMTNSLLYCTAVHRVEVNKSILRKCKAQRFKTSIQLPTIKSVSNDL